MNRDHFLVESRELLAEVGNPKIRIFDATIMFYMGLSPEEIAKMPTAREQYLAGHIPGAAFFDHQEFSDSESPYEYMLANDEVLADRIGKVGISNDSVVILYTTGILACATRAWWLLRYAGLKNVRVLNGGFAAWKEAGGGVEQGDQTYAPVHFEGNFRKDMFATINEVQEAIKKENVLLENALTLDWHDQEHIPGSSCLPLTNLTIEWNAFLPNDQLAAQLRSSEQNKRIINYCGGGIAATVNAMAHLMVGDENVAVYDGSLFEWKGEGRPVTSAKA